MMAAGGGFYTEHTQACKIIGHGKKASIPFWYQIRDGDRRRQAHMQQKSEWWQWGLLAQRGLSVWPGERRDWLGGGPAQTMRKHLVHFHLS